MASFTREEAHFSVPQPRLFGTNPLAGMMQRRDYGDTLPLFTGGSNGVAPETPAVISSDKGLSKVSP
jgi:hypothetical protein